MSATQFHQPIGFVCCLCGYRSSGSLCSNPDRPDCAHRAFPRCQRCAIIFTGPRYNDILRSDSNHGISSEKQYHSQTKGRHRSFDSVTSDGSVDGGFICSYSGRQTMRRDGEKQTQQSRTAGTDPQIILHHPCRTIEPSRPPSFSVEEDL
ncbi:hypothetical protein F4806DRAFT_473123 [Annulohypoxylon nitens]|nr:hypothetical protein F4806DRAFT_473123 [Annulohypoxylon nitens]